MLACVICRPLALAGCSTQPCVPDSKSQLRQLPQAASAPPKAHTHWLAEQILVVAQSLDEQHAELAKHVPLHSLGLLLGQPQALLLQVFPPVHSLDEQQAVLAIQAPLQSLVVPAQTQALPVQVMPVPQSFAVQHALLAMQTLPHFL